MNLILHELKHSPFCIPVRRILDAYGVPFECLEVSNWDRRKLACLTEGNYYQVPVIEHGDNIVYETESDPLAVAHYLDSNFANGIVREFKKSSSPTSKTPWRASASG